MPSPRRDAPVRNAADSAPDGAEPARSEPVVLPWWAAIWRVAATLIVLGILVLGQLHHTDDYFPLGALAMFAQERDPNGTIDSTCLEGAAAGEPVRTIPISPRTVGLGRVELEAQLRRYRADPEALGEIAAAYDARHPGAAPLARLDVCVDRYHLKNGAPDGEPEHRVLVRWESK